MNNKILPTPIVLNAYQWRNVKLNINNRYNIFIFSGDTCTNFISWQILLRISYLLMVLLHSTHNAVYLSLESKNKIYF
jgi:hypothetical protein